MRKGARPQPGPFLWLGSAQRWVEALRRPSIEAAIQRDLAKGLLDGPSSPRVRDLLADLLVTRLEQARERRGAAPRLPIPLAAQGLAHAQLGLLRSWLEGHA